MVYAPVVLFVYNRPEETRKTIAALRNNLLAAQSDLYIFSDAAKTSWEEQAVGEVRELIRTATGFQSVTVNEASGNKGLANSIIKGIDQVIRKHGRVIVLEDDLITSPNFLSFMNQSLSLYEDTKDVISTTGLTYDVNIPPGYPYDVYFTRRMCSCGWGTWQDRWEEIDWSVSDYPSFRYNIRKNLQFMRGGEDLPRMLGAYRKGKIDSWAIRFAYHQYKTNTYTVYPVKSLIDNIGFDRAGTNTIRRKKYDVIDFVPSSETDFSFPETVLIDKRINRSFLRKYRIINRIIANYFTR